MPIKPAHPKTFAQDLWFGDYTQESIDQDVTTQRHVHWLESRAYQFVLTGTPGNKLDLLLPCEVRHFDTGGPYLAILNDSASTDQVRLKTNDGTLVADGTASAGSGMLIFLLDNTTQYGTWFVRRNVWGPIPVKS